MVGGLGMGSTLISVLATQAPTEGNLAARVLSTDEGRTEVEGLLAYGKAEATKMLDENRHVVEALRDALLDRDELVGNEILDVIRQTETQHDVAFSIPVVGASPASADLDPVARYSQQIPDSNP